MPVHNLDEIRVRGDACPALVLQGNTDIRPGMQNVTTDTTDRTIFTVQPMFPSTIDPHNLCHKYVIWHDLSLIMIKVAA